MLSSSLALCIPAYNAAIYLPRLLESALRQTSPFDEIWVYDDCSTDNTSDIAHQFGARVVRGDVNRGCSYGKNKLAEHTTCEWIHFHDADDLLYSNFVDTAHSWMLQSDSPDVVLFGYEYREDETEALILTHQFDDQALRKDAIAYAIQHQINPFCGLYRRSAFLEAGGYDTDPAILYNEDVAFHCRLAIAGLRFAADPTVAIVNYRRARSMSGANQHKCVQAQYQVMAKVAAAVPGRYQQEIAQRLWQIAGVSASYLDWQTTDACATLAQSLTDTAIISPRAWFNRLCHWNPYIALRLREYLIRQFKPSLRLAEYPLKAAQN